MSEGNEVIIGQVMFDLREASTKETNSRDESPYRRHASWKRISNTKLTSNDFPEILVTLMRENQNLDDGKKFLALTICKV